MIDDRMAHYGLRMGENAHAIAIDEVKRWIETGGTAKSVTRTDVLKAIERRSLRASIPSNPKVALWIHGWAKRAYDVAPTVELDWSSYFEKDSRRIPSERHWRGRLLPDLLRAKRSLARRADGAYIDLRAKLPLSHLCAIGFAFPESGGFSFRVEQATRGEVHLWNSSTGSICTAFASPKDDDNTQADDVVVALSVTDDARQDVERSRTAFPKHARFVFAVPEPGVSDDAIGSGRDAVGLAVSAKKLLQATRRRLCARRLHLVLYAPAAFALFLGQRLNALGEVILYERTADGIYRRALEIQTG